MSEEPSAKKPRTNFVGASSPPMASVRLEKMCLEAIFHPKFDNENRTTMDIRRRMLAAVGASEGYLEASLKHSGSLVLWSGGMRYYSKNSMENSFTYVGEILLRQHLARAWIRDDAVDSAKDLIAERKYHELSREVESRRLTLSFEVVTSVLGQHGAMPRKDFLILTAVACRTQERFFGTSELVAYAQRFRLPHNDSWVFRSVSSAERLFDLYDTTRETAMADGTVASLTASCDGGHVRSIYPHAEFQGNILEGLVIRYVPYCTGGASNVDVSSRDVHTAEQQRITQDLAMDSERILQLVPPDRPPCFELPQISTSVSKVLTTDIRQLSQLESGVSFEVALHSVLLHTDGHRRQTCRLSERLGKGGECVASSKFDLVTSVREMVNHHGDLLDIETRRVANLVQKLDEINIPVEYKVFREEMKKRDGNQEHKRTRWLCIIHVLSDFSFQKYQKGIQRDDMKLYRGFCIRLVFDDEEEDDDDASALSYSGRSESDYIYNDEKGLMLKMKFLPYMVRTFGIRNGLSTLMKSGPEAYDRYSMNLLKTWDTSQNVMSKWQSFFHSWGMYAHAVLRQQEQQEPIASDRVAGGDPLPLLSSQNYLEHLEYFSELYYSGKLPGGAPSGRLGECTFRGFVAVVALNKEEASIFSDKIALELGGCRRAHDIRAITEDDILNSIVQGTGGLVCSVIVEDGMKTVRLLSKKYKQSIYVVLAGCSDDDVNKSLSPGRERKKRFGMIKGWRKLHCRFQVDLPRSSLLQNTDDAATDEATAERSDLPSKEFINLINRLREASESLPKPDTRPGMLMFFPGVPGCGKSSICNAVTTDTLRSCLVENGCGSDEEIENSDKCRVVVVRVGDQVQGKYWPLVRQERTEQPSSVYIADKNAPPTIWETVGEIGAKTHGVPVPVLPDGEALTTTVISWTEATGEDVGIFREYTFPFSLQYLAVCMARVLARPGQSHCGKLDASCQTACMIVVKFYCLYRNLTARRLIDLCRDAMDKAGALKAQSAIEVPFFAKDVPQSFPQDLKEVIQDAIRLQCKLDSQSSKENSSDGSNEVEEMEKRLRLVLESNRDELQRYTVSEKESQDSFLTQIAEHVDALDGSFGSLEQTFKSSSGPSFIKIASIDVDLKDVQLVLRRMAAANSNLASYIDSIGTYSEIGDGLNQNESKGTGGQLVQETHITMAHHSQLSQMEMRSRFGTLEGSEVEVQITGLLYGKSIAALSVALPPTTMGPLPIAIPAPQNEFPHVTIWFGDSASAADSNKLPTMVHAGKATKLQISEPISITGRFRFWMRNNDAD